MQHFLHKKVNVNFTVGGGKQEKNTVDEECSNKKLAQYHF